jgi:phosphate starvation-inducible protein PhoH and related proteins
LDAHKHHFALAPEDNRRLAGLCGQFNEHLKQIELSLGVEIHHRGYHFQIKGTPEAIALADKVIRMLYNEANKSEILTPTKVHLFLQGSKANHIMAKPDQNLNSELVIRCQRAAIKPYSVNQQRYVENILKHDINFGVGPAGTGKTYLAVACAVAALEQEKVSRILLVRPAVEAGEKLGFLPGDFSQKVDPYFRPLYDALYEMLGADTVTKLIEQHVIEVTPLAYMRGRTLNDAFVILDEAQNTTKEQMKMFLTRVGFNSKVVINGDVTQTDLPKGTESGLRHCLEVLKEVPGLSFTYFQASDVVRHPLVQGILEAYGKHEAEKK